MADDLQNIIAIQDWGDGDMGSLTFMVTPVGGSEDTNGKARFSIPGQRFALSSIRAHFVGGSGTADLVLNVDSGLDAKYDFALLTIENAGTGTEVHRRMSREDQEHFMFDGTRGDELVLTWTNPDSGNMTWGVEVFLKPIDEGAQL